MQCDIYNNVQIKAIRIDFSEICNLVKILPPV